MKLIFILLILIIILFASYIISIKPYNKRKKRMEAFTKSYIAHRGLFNNKDVPENSLLAFKYAVNYGFGIELDVQITKDGKLVVFHDKTLKRMCNDKRVLYKLTYNELNQICLLNTGERIPLFSEALAVIDGKVPLVVEIKPEGEVIKTTELANEMLKKYNGIYCIESFHPMVLKWLKKNNPEVLRGQLSTVYTRRFCNKPRWMRFMLSNLMTNIITSPDFIAYNHKYKNRFTYKLCRLIYNPVSVAWTIRSQRELEAAKDVYQAFIFDSFMPK